MKSPAVGIPAVNSFMSLTGGATESLCAPHHTHTLQNSQKINNSEDNTGLFLALQEEWIEYQTLDDSSMVYIVVVQSLGRVWLFATPQTGL